MVVPLQAAQLVSLICISLSYSSQYGLPRVKSLLPVKEIK